jgi:hypothetical protein
MLRTAFFIIGGVLIVVLAIFLGQRFWQDKSQLPTSVVEAQTAAELTEAARYLNAQAPIQLDEITTLESAETDHIVMIYNNKVARDASEFERATFEAERRTFLVEFVCGNDDMVITLDAGGSFRYNWVDKSDQFIGTVTITGSDCP